MKRFHVHVRVDELAQSVRFYSTLFATEPTVLKPDYAKWMLDDPRVNFAISTHCGEAAGISHLGIQAEDENELGEVYERLARAERPVVEEKATTCCYAVSDKQWVADPQGVESSVKEAEGLGLLDAATVMLPDKATHQALARLHDAAGIAVKATVR